MPHRVLSALALLFLVVTLASPARAQGQDEPARVMIVFDGSGSMWGRIEGRTKIEIAREALAEAMTGLPENVEIGLVAYGHREKGNCADIENLVSPALGAGPAIGEAVGRISPKGKTPLSEAVRQAAEALKFTENKATVILITDGIETCDADPCALGAELEKLGVDFTAHVVGFGLSREEGRQVACLAENTGGRYIEAGNAAELGKAVNEGVARADKPVPAEPVTLPEASVSTKANPAIGASLEVAWTGPGSEGDYIDIVPPGYEETGGELSYRYTVDGNPAVLSAPGEPGSYEVRYVWSGPDKRHVLASTSIEVGDSEVALIFPQSVTGTAAISVQWKGPGQEGDYIDIVPAGYTETSGEISYAYVADGNPAQMKAPGNAGEYSLRYILAAPEGRKVLLEQPLSVTEVSATLSVAPSFERGEPITVFWQGPGGGDYIDLVPAGYTETSGELSYFYVVDYPESGELSSPEQAGQYDVRYILEAPEGRRVLAKTTITVQ